MMRERTAQAGVKRIARDKPAPAASDGKKYRVRCMALAPQKLKKTTCHLVLPCIPLFTRQPLPVIWLSSIISKGGWRIIYYLGAMGEPGLLWMSEFQDKSSLTIVKLSRMRCAPGRKLRQLHPSVAARLALAAKRGE